MNHIYSYPTVYAIGHKAISELFIGPVTVEEKIDGSQFSMMWDGKTLACRSKGKDIILEVPEDMFVKAIEVARGLNLMPNWIYRCEYLSKPKHNTLKYDRVPAKHLIIYDVGIGPESYMSHEDKAREAARIGLECVPLLYQGVVSGMDQLAGFLDRTSILGGTTIEGVVVKNYAIFTGEKKVAMGKYVSERFKEVHAGDWKERNPHGKDIIQRLTEKYRTEARWEKAAQHLRDAGQLEGSPRDIGNLFKEVPADVLKECEEDIVAELMAWAWPQIRRGLGAGLPEWYKQQLAESAFYAPAEMVKESDDENDTAGT